MRDLFEAQNTPRTVLDLREGDCLAGMAALAEGSVDVVVTSPPYNLDIGYSKFRDNAPRGEYLDWCVRWCTEVKRVLREDGSFFLNVGASPATPQRPHQLAVAVAPLFCLQNTIHWIKSITVKTPVGPELSVGHFKPINSKRFLTDCHEHLFHFTKSGNVVLDRLAVGVEYADKSNIARWSHTSGQDRRCRGNTWFVPYETIQRREAERPHPATFPVQLAERCLKLHGLRPDLTVLDPFLGIGSSALAAIRCGAARFVGFEIDEGYLTTARDRIEQAMS